MPERTDTSTWRDLLGEARILVSGFGRWGGGVYDLTSGAPQALDDLATSGLALGAGRLWRVLRAPGEQTSVCELLSYDARGVRSYQRLDAVRDPHDVLVFDGVPHISSSWDNAVWRVDGGRDEPELAWQGSTVPDGWHVNSLVAVDGALHVCAFGRFDRYKGWKAARQDGAGFVHDLRAGRDVLSGLRQPHTPRRRGTRWFVCESSKGWLTELAADGTVRRRARVRRFTRGLAFVGPFALVGGNAHREQDDDRAEIAVVDLRTMAVVERIPMPCLEVYDIVPVSAAVARGVATGFGTNASRAAEQHRATGRAGERRPAPDGAAVRLVTPRTAGALAAMGRPLDPEEATRCGVRGSLPPVVAAGEVTTWRVEVANRSGGALGTVPPRPVKVGIRWFRLPDGPGSPAPGPAGIRPDDRPGRGPAGPSAGDVPTRANPLAPLRRVVPPGMRALVDVPVEVPDEPGRYEVRVALRQPGTGWFGIRAHGEVVVKPGG